MQQFEFFEKFREILWKMLVENVLLPNNFFHNLILLQIQTCRESFLILYARDLKLG